MYKKISCVFLFLFIIIFAGCISANQKNLEEPQKALGNNTQEQLQGPQKIFSDESVEIKINETSKINSSTLEHKIHELINAEREKLSLGKLEWNSHLAYIARGHSRDMSARDYFAHEDLEGRRFTYRYEVVNFTCEIVIETTATEEKIAKGAENLFMTHIEKRQWFENGVYVRSDYNTEDEIATSVVLGWMNSTTHRDDIVKPFWNSEGIGVVISSNNTVYVTENFC